MINIRLPNINGSTEKLQLEQIKRYLFQIAEDLNYAVKSIDNNQTKMSEQIVQVSESSSKSKTSETLNEQFNALKPLIIKSADIVNSFYEKISTELEGEFVASSEFGIYKEETNLVLEQTSENITQNYKLIEQIDGWKRDTEACIRTGWLNGDDDAQNNVYGMEIGQTTTIDGETIFRKYARYTANKISFFDAYGNEQGYLSDKTLYINNIIVKGAIYLGDVKFDTSQGGVAAKWAAGEVIWQE